MNYLRLSSPVIYLLVAFLVVVSANDFVKEYADFFNFGVKKPKENAGKESSVSKPKVEVLGEVFKEKISEIKAGNKQLDVVFLLDASSSIGEVNFKNELKFVRKLLSDVTVDYNHSRVALITYSSRNKIFKSVDEISNPKVENNKCLLLNNEIDNITYTGGDTYTLGAFETAKEIFEKSRTTSRKVLFLITDGFSNGGDPVPVAQELKKNNVTIFTIGIKNGNFQELYELSSTPGEYYSYLLDSYNQFESLARRALHVDLQMGEYIPLGTSKPCDNLCKEGNCCDEKALCTCGTSTGHYTCVCKPGYYGSGLHNDCSPCPENTFANGPNLCLPCPDPNQEAKIRSVGIESCKCKTGYQPTNDNKCEVLKCEKLTAPEHGYFVKKRECANVLNSACGIRCQIGYILEGTSIRLCQANATWSGKEPSCLVRTCEALTTPQHGNITCKHQELEKTYTVEPMLPVDTVCSFSCDPGRTLLGSKQRTCLPLAHWDGLKTSCKLVKCNKLPKIPFGQIKPSSCQVGKQSFGKECSISCEDGFELVGPKKKICNGLHGNWNNKRENKCRDITKPILKCPDNIKNNTVPGKNYGYAHWNPINVTDNSGLNVTTWTKPSISEITNFKFKLGTTNITYFAQDFQRNVARCNFLVEIIDNEKPTIELCTDPPPYLTFDKKGADITWDEPDIYDNSRNVKVEKSHEFGFFKIGTTQVIYKAIDLSNNTNVCVLNITVEHAVCDPLPSPIYGKSNCTSLDSGMQCVITCEEGYALPIPLQSESIAYGDSQYFCNEENPPWVEDKVFPECTLTEIPLELIEKITMHIEPKEIEDICDDENRLSELNKNVANDLENNLEDACNDIDCFLETESECEEENTNIVKRNAEEGEKKKRKRVKIKLRVNAKNKPNKRRRFKKVRDDLKKIQSLDGNPVTSIRFQMATLICPEGCVLRKQKCVRCPLGTFHNVTANACQSCGLGLYNDKEASTQCSTCPEHYSTKKLHSKSIKDCVEKCPPGKIGRKKTIKPKNHPNAVIEKITLPPYCRSCPLGQYQPNYGQHECLKCPSGYTTLSFGSKSIQDCVPSVQLTCSNVSICNHGKCIVQDNFYYSCECNDLFIGSHCETKINSCLYSPCLHGGTCKLKPDGLNYSCSCPDGYTGINCEISEEKCTLQCLNGGTCLDDDQGELCVCPDGFGGSLCEMKLSYCSAKLCENNSTCVEDINGFNCICQMGFFGRRCTYLPCDFQPCPKNSICENVYVANSTRNNFKCLCLDGYTGDNCTEILDPCHRNNCRNNATCRSIDKSYTCECASGFYGDFCDEKVKDRYILSFNRAGVTDSVRLAGFKFSLDEISVCTWIQTLDYFNYGTVVSYATRQNDNAFTITDYAGLVFYINNKTIISDIKLNDGFWHYFCFTWSGLKGTYHIYVDGKVAQKGNEFGKGEYLEANGTMMIGQEQDIMGGKFSQSEAFLGKLSEFDMWSRILNAEEIKTIMTSCNGQKFGDVYPWPMMKNYVFGRVKIEASPFCQNCKPPNSLYNGHVEIKNNTAYYICNKGFALSESTFLNGRKCNKATEWEDRKEPFCRPVYCGYPGYIRHGRIFGRKYSYLNEIKHICNPGYTLVGSDIRKCNENGVWEPDAPKCEGKKCKAFQVPEHSKITVFSDYSDEYVDGIENFDMGTSIEIVCEQGAKLVGENVLTCTENAEWDNEIPVCVSTKPKSPDLPCPTDHIPPPPENGFIVEKSKNNVLDGNSNIVEYGCNEGYTLKGVATSTCIVDGYWTEPNITCQMVKCPTAPKIKNGKITKDFEKNIYKGGDSVKYECLQGYRLQGNPVVKCTDQGKWSRARPRCSKISCGKPNVSEHTDILGDSYLFGETVTLVCGDNNNYKITCDSSGKWIGDTHTSC